MNQKFRNAFEKLLKYEGGYSNHQNDSGGKTKYGITESLAREVGYDGDMKDLTKEEAAEIYYNHFWTKYRYNEIEDKRVAFECFEQAVNLGPDDANTNLQESYNLLVKDEIVVDGIIGPKTLSAVNSLGAKDYSYLLELLNIMQGNKYIEIVQSNNSQKVFIRGWLRRVRLKVNKDQSSNDKDMTPDGKEIINNPKLIKAILIVLGSGAIIKILEFIL